MAVTPMWIEAEYLGQSVIVISASGSEGVLIVLPDGQLQCVHAGGVRVTERLRAPRGRHVETRS